MDDDDVNDGVRWLYHYTSAAGFQGIVTDCKLWITDARFLNDALELQFGRDELRTAIRDMPRSWHQHQDYPFSPQMKAADLLYSKLDQLLDYDESRDEQSGAQTAYVACFSSQAHQLSQWRSYGRDGYCLRFDRDSLTRSMPDRSEFAQIVYGTDAITPMVRRAMSTLDRLVHAALTASNQISLQLSSEASMYPEILAELSRVKHQAFEEEHEWRLIIVGRPEAVGPDQFRIGSVGLTPYFSVPFDRKSLSLVDVAPGPHQHLRAAAARRLLDSLELEHVRVRRDEAPLR